MEHSTLNDDHYDPEIEYEVQWKISKNKLNTIKFKTLKDLFNDLYNNEHLIFDTEEKKEKVRSSLNKNFRYNQNGIVIIQFDVAIDENICTCPPGFKGEGAFCKKHKD